MPAVFVYSFWISIGFVFFFATWDRIETLVPGIVLLAVTLIASCIVAFIRREKCSRLQKIDWVVFVLLLYVVTRAYFSPVTYYSKLDISLALLGGSIWLGLPLLIGRSLLLDTFKKGLLVVFFTVFLANLLGSIYQLTFDKSWGLFVTRSEVAQNFISGVFSHYNYFSNFAMTSVFVGVAGAISMSSNNGWRKLCWAMIVGNIGLLFLANSRGAFVAIALATLVIVMLIAGSLRYSENKKRVLGLYLGAMILALVGLIWGATLGEERGWLSKGGIVVDNGRQMSSAIAVDQIFEYPWVGAGSRSFEWKSIELWPDDLWQGTKNLDYVHNEYFQMAAEYGAIGLIGLLVSLLGVVGILFYRVCIRSSSISSNAWGLSSVAALIGFGVQCFFSFPAHIPACFVAIVVFVRVGLLEGQEVAEQRYSRSLASCFHIFAVLFAAGSMIFVMKNETSAFVLYLKENDTHVDYFEGDLREVDLKIENLSSVTKHAPNHDRLESLGLLAWNASRLASGNDQQYYLELSRQAFAEAVSLYPMSPFLHNSYAFALAKNGDFDLAEKHYGITIKLGKNREYWTKAAWSYAQLCKQRGDAYWNERNPQKAYYYYQKSKKLISQSMVRRSREEKKHMTEQLNAYIKLLEKAGFSNENQQETNRFE